MQDRRIEAAELGELGVGVQRVLVPGETIRTEMWREDGRILVSAKTVERDSPVISNCAVTLR